MKRNYEMINENLSEMSLLELQNACRQRGLQITGRKNILLKKIEDFDAKPIHNHNLSQIKLEKFFNLERPYHISIREFYDKEKENSVKNQEIICGTIMSDLNDTSDILRNGKYIRDLVMSTTQSGKANAGFELEKILISIFSKELKDCNVHKTKIQNIEFDVGIFKKGKIIGCISCKTKLRERYKQDEVLRKFCRKNKIKFYALTLDKSKEFYISIQENVIEKIIKELNEI